MNSDSATGDLPNAAAIDRMVHEPARLLVISQLMVVAQADFNYLMRRTGLTWGNLSSHLIKL